jgi:hypothetical protein
MRSLKGLSDKELLNRLRNLVKKEHNLTLEILPHLIEVENRKIYRALGYSSMFVYCTDGLGYSESSAQRRICAARAIRRCPEAYDYLRDGRVNLSTLSIVWKYITRELLVEIIGKSQRQVFGIVARFEPRIQYRDDTRPVVIRLPAESRRERQPAGAINVSGESLTVGAPLKGSIGQTLADGYESSPLLGEILIQLAVQAGIGQYPRVPRMVWIPFGIQRDAPFLDFSCAALVASFA